MLFARWTAKSEAGRQEQRRVRERLALYSKSWCACFSRVPADGISGIIVMRLRTSEAIYRTPEGARAAWLSATAPR